MTDKKLTNVDFWYGSSRNERYDSDLNTRVEDALTEKFGKRFIGLDGGSSFGGEEDTPNMSDNIPMILVESKEEAEEALAIIKNIVQRPVEMTVAEEN